MYVVLVFLLQVVVLSFFASDLLAGTGNFTTRECEDVRYTYVRYGSSYTFFHELKNNSSRPVYLQDKYIRFIDNKGNVIEPGKEHALIQRGSQFRWNPELVKQDYAVFPETNIQTVKTGGTNWRFNKHPQSRNDLSNNEYDLMIQYQVAYSVGKKAADSTTKILRTSCNYYATTWCGDGYLDTHYRAEEHMVKSEECDDGNQLNGDGCNSLCMKEK